MKKLFIAATSVCVFTMILSAAFALQRGDKPIMPGMIKEQPKGEGAADKPKMKMDHVGGCVLSVDPKTMTVVIQNRQGEKIKFVANPATQFVKNKQNITINDIKVKDHLSVAFRGPHDGDMEVVMMMVSEASTEAFCK